VIEWIEECNFTAADLFTTAKRQQTPQRDEARELLQRLLSSGERPATEVFHFGRELRISGMTIRRAAESMGVLKRRNGGIARNGKWMWGLTKVISPL
jgi:hypothetical protein